MLRLWLPLLLILVSHTAAAPRDVSRQSGGATAPGDGVAARAWNFAGGVEMCSRRFPGPLSLRGGGEGKEGQTMSERKRRKKERRRREKEKEMANRSMGEVPEIKSVGEVPASNVPTGDEAAAIAKMRSEAKLQTPVLDSTSMHEKERRRDTAGGGAVDQLERRSEGLQVHVPNMEDAVTMEDQLGFEQRVLKEAQVPPDVPSSHAGRDDASLYDSPPRKEVATAQGSQHGATTPTLRYDAEDGMDAEEEGLTWSAFRQKRAQEIADSFAGQDLAGATPRRQSRMERMLQEEKDKQDERGVALQLARARREAKEQEASAAFQGQGLDEVFGAGSGGRGFRTSLKSGSDDEYRPLTALEKRERKRKEQEEQLAAFGGGLETLKPRESALEKEMREARMENAKPLGKAGLDRWGRRLNPKP